MLTVISMVSTKKVTKIYRDEIKMELKIYQTQKEAEMGELGLRGKV